MIGDDYYKAPWALTKKLIDGGACSSCGRGIFRERDLDTELCGPCREELVKCERCPRRVHHEASYWFNDERAGKTLLCSFCYRELMK